MARFVSEVKDTSDGFILDLRGGHPDGDSEVIEALMNHAKFTKPLLVLVDSSTVQGKADLARHIQSSKRGQIIGDSKVLIPDHYIRLPLVYAAGADEGLQKALSL